MNKILQQILAGIENDEPEAFLGASELSRAKMIGLNGTAVTEPYASLYAEQPFSDEDLAILKTALLDYLRSDRTQNAATAIHALGELRDLELIPVLRTMLVKHLDRLIAQSHVVGNLIVTLSNFGEDVIRGTSYSCNAIDKNIADARRYLARIDIRKNAK